MNVSLDWLGVLLDTKLDAGHVSHELAMLGSPVESVTRANEGLDDVIVALVERVEQHPNADRLSVCQVNNGSEVVEVVCGAPNVAAGVRYPFAPIGSVLPGGVKLKRSKIRGVQSNGMLCSAKELELGGDADGIMPLDADTALGTKLVTALGIDDVCLDVEVTPNRPDLLCHRGVARELGAVIGRPVKLEHIPGGPGETKTLQRHDQSGTVGGLEVRIDDTDGCYRFLAAVIRGVRIGPSPDWLQRRLQSVGQRCINNVVDVTNYIIREMNHPMHAYDLDRLAGPSLIARAATGGEKLKTLDDVERVMQSGMTMICDANGPTGIGGVMGGASSEVRSDTTNIVLEAAFFNPKRIRKTRVALQMSTDASYRFERGVDIQGMTDAFHRAVELMLTTAGGEEADNPVDIYPKPERIPSVFLRPEQVQRLLGVEIGRDEIEKYLTALGFAVAPKDDRFAVQPPGWRPDVTREVDLIEEIARVRGYDSFPIVLRPFRPSQVPHESQEAVKGRARVILTGFGLHEARSSSLGSQVGDDAQAVLNPLSMEEKFLRTDLVTGLVRAVQHNWSVKQRDIRLFEVGVVFAARGADRLPKETLRVAGVVTGSQHPHHWSIPNSVDFDIWDVKSFLAALAGECGPPGRVVTDEGRVTYYDQEGTVRGWAGPVTIDVPAWAAPVFSFELDLATSLKAARSHRNLPALMLPDGILADQVEAVIKKRGGGYLESCAVFDEYRGTDNAGRSVAWRLVFRARDKTLRDKDIDGAVDKVLRALKEQLGVERR